MAGFALEVSLNELGGWLSDRADALGRISLERPWRDVRLLLVSEARQCFDQGRGPDGVAWAPLRGASAKRGGASAKPLRDTGLLMASVTAQGQGHVEEQGAYSLIWGTRAPQAAVMQFGHTFSRPEKSRGKPWVFTGSDGKTVFARKIRAHQQSVPARPFLGLAPALVKKIEFVFEDFLAKAIF